jgi:hypothetical protein
MSRHAAFYTFSAKRLTGNLEAEVQLGAALLALVRANAPHSTLYGTP